MDSGFLDTGISLKHDRTVRSVSISLPGDLDVELLEEWMQNLILEKGHDIYRAKGVVSIADVQQKFVFHGVHMVFDSDFLPECWTEDEPRESKLVFIGKNLDQEELRQGVSECLSTPELHEQRLKSLRFAIGDQVQCKTPKGWIRGKVTQTMHHDKRYMQPGRKALYRILLDIDGGRSVFIMHDDPSLIQPLKKSY